MACGRRARASCSPRVRCIVSMRCTRQAHGLVVWPPCQWVRHAHRFARCEIVAVGCGCGVYGRQADAPYVRHALMRKAVRCACILGCSTCMAPCQMVRHAKWYVCVGVRCGRPSAFAREAEVSVCVCMYARSRARVGRAPSSRSRLRPKAGRACFHPFSFSSSRHDLARRFVFEPGYRGLYSRPPARGRGRSPA